MPRESFRDMIARTKAETEARRKKIVDAFASSAAVHAIWLGAHPRSEMWILSVDTHPVPEGKERPYRITRFGTDGPWGHEVGAREELIKEASSMWAPSDVLPMTETQVIEWTSTREFQQGVLVVNYMQALNTLSWTASQARRYDDVFRPAQAAAVELTNEGRWEEATELLTRMLREHFPTPNPAPEFVQNPAWTTRVIAENFDNVSREMGLQWLPKLGEIRSNRNRLTASVSELGCGAYGCVFPTPMRGVVLKLTTDITEWEYVNDIAPKLRLMITTKYLAWMRMQGKHEGRPVYALWREEAWNVGKIHEVIRNGTDALIAIRRQHDAASKILVALMRDQFDAVRGLLGVWGASVHAMMRFPELAFVARGMIDAWEDRGVFFADVHEGNLGMVSRQLEGGGKQDLWVITDPGNVIVVGSGKSAAELEAEGAPRNNPPRTRKPQSLEDRRAAQEAAQHQRLRNVAFMMSDIMGDPEWEHVAPEQLEKWLDLGPVYSPNEKTTRELCEELIEQSVAPEHCR